MQSIIVSLSGMEALKMSEFYLLIIDRKGELNRFDN